MAVKNHAALLKKLKKQIRELQRKEEESRKKLRAALSKARKLGRVYKSKLADVYAKVALDLERSMLKTIESKGRAIANAVKKFEKKHIVQLAKRVARKGKKNR